MCWLIVGIKNQLMPITQCKGMRRLNDNDVVDKRGLRVYCFLKVFLNFRQTVKLNHHAHTKMLSCFTQNDIKHKFHLLRNTKKNEKKINLVYCFQQLIFIFIMMYKKNWIAIQIIDDELSTRVSKYRKKLYFIIISGNFVLLLCESS